MLMGVPTDHERLFEKPYELEMFNICNYSATLQTA